LAVGRPRPGAVVGHDVEPVDDVLEGCRTVLGRAPGSGIHREHVPRGRKTAAKRSFQGEQESGVGSASGILPVQVESVIVVGGFESLEICDQRWNGAGIGFETGDIAANQQQDLCAGRVRAGDERGFDELVGHLQVAVGVKANTGVDNVCDLAVRDLCGGVGVRRGEKFAAGIVIGDQTFDGQ
jgi:hypothetical protein